jgi:hypothetical protein
MPMGKRKHRITKAIRPLVSVTLAAAGAYPAIAPLGLENPLVAVLAIIDKATVFDAIAVQGFFDFLCLILWHRMG